MGIDFTGAVAASLAVACACGMGAALGCRRLAGLSPKRRRRPARRLSERGMVEMVTRALPLSADSEQAARAALERSGVRMDPQELWALRVLLAGVGLAAGAVAAGAAAGPWAWLLTPVLGAVGFVAPQLWLIGAGRRWRDDIERELPNALDLMGVSVAAGTSFEAAVRIVASRTTGALAESLADVVAASEFSSMTEALQTFAAKAQVEPLTIFVASLAQAQRSGIPVADILHSQAASVRTYRRQRIEEQANKLPTKMIFPELLIFAAIVVAIMAPTVAQIVAGMG